MWESHRWVSLRGKGRPPLPHAELLLPASPGQMRETPRLPGQAPLSGAPTLGRETETMEKSQLGAGGLPQG